MDPAAAALDELARAHVPHAARVLRLAATGDATADPLAQLRAEPPGAWDAVLSSRPTLAAPLMPFLSAAHAALPQGGLLLLADLVWQTAPTPALLRAFAASPGRDKTRPIEGYEMQLEHSGFEVRHRAALDRAAWVASLDGEQRAAVDADDRGAAKLALWVLERIPESD